MNSKNMKSVKYVVAVLVAGFIQFFPLHAFANEGQSNIVAPHILLTEVGTQRPVSLKQELADSPFTVLVFLSSECLPTNAYGERLQDIQDNWKEHGIRVIGINSNPHEAKRQIAAHRVSHGITFPVLMDTEQILANTLRAKHSPEFFVFDRKGHLVARGGTAEHLQPFKENVTRELEDTINALITDQPLPVLPATTAGCGIIRRG